MIKQALLSVRHTRTAEHRRATVPDHIMQHISLCWEVIVQTYVFIVIIP
jgi:hypothetical protein